MARLNEPSVSADSFEALRRKLLRQNRDLAKCNNARAIRVKELELDLGFRMAQNVTLNGRIIELEHQLQDSEAARRIAAQVINVKSLMEEQLVELSRLVSGLDTTEPPTKRHSSSSVLSLPSPSRTPRKGGKSDAAKRISEGRRRRLSSSAGAAAGAGLLVGRPSPSQRRLRDMAREIEHLGSIQENKPCSRMSMNPDQIRALQCEADDDSTESPELGPPPMSRYVDGDQSDNDFSSLPHSPSPTNFEPSTQSLESPEPSTPRRAQEDTQDPDLSRGQAEEEEEKVNIEADSGSFVSTGNAEPISAEDETTTEPQPEKAKSRSSRTKASPNESSQQQTKAASKRKYAQPITQFSDIASPTNLPAPSLEAGKGSHDPQKSKTGPREKASIREKSSGKTLRELAIMRRESKENEEQKDSTNPTTIAPPALSTRKPLSAKSTNEDIASPKKSMGKELAADLVATAKAKNKMEGKETKAAKKTEGTRQTKKACAEVVQIEPVEMKSTTSPTTAFIEVDDANTEAAKATNDLKSVESVLVEPAKTPVIAHIEPAVCEKDTQSQETPNVSCSQQEPVSVEAARPSRRARASVSYAEPNLRDKMRRPGKEISDAVKVMTKPGQARSEGQLLGASVPENEKAQKLLETKSPLVGKGQPRLLVSTTPVMQSPMLPALDSNKHKQNNNLLDDVYNLPSSSPLVAEPCGHDDKSKPSISDGASCTLPVRLSGSVKSRKRASMATVSTMVAAGSGSGSDDSSASNHSGGAAPTGRVKAAMRRRSMML